MKANNELDQNEIMIRAVLWAGSVTTCLIIKTD